MQARCILAITAITFGLNAGLAYAQPYERGDGHRREAPQRHMQDHRHPAAKPGHRPAPPPHRGPGAGPDHRFHKGDRLPVEYRGRHFMIDDWRAHRLSPPPRGHRWVQVGADYVLIAVATGIITHIILSH